MAGGYICAQCGCETNRAGEKVADGHLVRVPAARWVMLAVALLAAVGLLAAVRFTGPKRIENGPRVELPRQAAMVSSAR